MSEVNGKEKIKKIKLSTVLYGGVFFVLFLVICFSVYVYKFTPDNLVLNKIGEKLPLPAIIINGREFISIGEISSNLHSIKRFYEKQDFSSLGYRVDFSTADGKKRLKIRERELINKTIEDRAIELLAKKKNIEITDKAVDEAVDRKLLEYGNKEDIIKNLKNLYGWSLNDFKTKIVKPSLYKEKLEKWSEKNIGKKEKEEAKKKITEAKERIDSGDTFEKIADDVNSKQLLKGGHLGWFKKEYLVSELQNTVVSMKKNEISGIIESKLGYHILKLNDKKNKDGEELYDLSQIFFPKMTFADWLDKEIKRMKIEVLLVGYKWDNKNGVVEFKDEKMKEFEKKSLNNPQRDVSLIAL